MGGVQSLGGRYITTITHNLRNPATGQHTQIGIYTLTQVREFFPIIGVMYAMHYQLLESHEAADWLWIRSYRTYRRPTFSTYLSIKTTQSLKNK